MSVEAVISTQVIDTTSVGRSVMTAADAAAVRTAADAQVTLVSGTNIKTVNSTSLLGSGDIAVGVSGTGAVDNAALRADGTGGATLQSSSFTIADNATASPNNTVNHASIAATGGTTNVSVSIVPKAAGAFCLAVPDGTATGGNARGANAVDLQTSRTTAAQVASGTASFTAGVNNTASNTGCVACGSSNTASGTNSFAFGTLCTAGGNEGSFAGGYNSSTTGGQASFAHGNSCSASGAYEGCVAHGYECTASGRGSRANGYASQADRSGQVASAYHRFAARGDAQYSRFHLMAKTTNSTPTTMLIGFGYTNTQFTIPSGKIMFADILISGIKSDGSAAACYKRKVAIKNVGGTTSLVGTVETIGTDIEDNASTDVAITADNTNDALQINVTGIAAETWRWVAVVEGLEIAYGT